MATDCRDTLPEKWQNFEFSNVIAPLLLMKQIQGQEPLDDPNIIVIAKNGHSISSERRLTLKSRDLLATCRP